LEGRSQRLPREFTQGFRRNNKKNTEHLFANISCPLTFSMHLLHTGRSQVNLQCSVLTTFFLLERFYDVQYEDSCGMRRLVFRRKKKSKCRRRDDILPGYVTINTVCKMYLFCHS
jgi:hypothetical protein